MSVPRLFVRAMPGYYYNIRKVRSSRAGAQRRLLGRRSGSPTGSLTFSQPCTLRRWRSSGRMGSRSPTSASAMGHRSCSCTAPPRTAACGNRRSPPCPTSSRSSPGTSRARAAPRIRPARPAAPHRGADPADLGEFDARSPLSVARQFDQAIADAKLVVIPGAGHVSNLEARAVQRRRARVLPRPLAL